MMKRLRMGKTHWWLLEQATQTNGILPVPRASRRQAAAARLLVSRGYFSLNQGITSACQKHDVYLLTPAGRTAIKLRRTP